MQGLKNRYEGGREALAHAFLASWTFEKEVFHSRGTDLFVLGTGRPGVHFFSPRFFPQLLFLVCWLAFTAKPAPRRGANETKRKL